MEEYHFLPLPEGTASTTIRLKYKRQLRKKGITTALIRALVEPHGHVESVTLAPHKGMAYVTLQNAEEAEVATRALHGVAHAGFFNARVYVAYVERLTPSQFAVRRCGVDDVAATADIKVPGMRLVEEFVTDEEEAALLEELSAGPWEALIARKVSHHGFRFNYKTRKADEDTSGVKQFSDAVATIATRLGPGGDVGCYDAAPNQMTVNLYEPGQGIASHVDTHSAFEGAIVSLTLGSGIVMALAHPDGRTKQLWLPPRSLLVLSGEARFLWKHGIANRKTDVVNGALVHRGTRLSATFRRVRRTPCDCEWPEQCDSQLAPPHISTLESKAPPELEVEHVHRLYDTIATHFSHTRYKPWPRIEAFVRSLPMGAVVADIGCGNGKYMGVNPNVVCLGMDRSVGLVTIAAEKGFQVGLADTLAVPLRSNCADAALSIAVLHHISTPERRLAAMRELVRILRPGGRLLVSVWAFEQQATSKRQFEKQDVMVPWCLGKRFVDEETIVAAHGVVDDERNVVVFNRYCHVYREGELEDLAGHLRRVKVVDSWYDRSNWCVIIEKLAGKRAGGLGSTSSSGAGSATPAASSGASGAGAGAGAGAGGGEAGHGAMEGAESSRIGLEAERLPLSGGGPASADSRPGRQRDKGED